MSIPGGCASAVKSFIRWANLFCFVVQQVLVYMHESCLCLRLDGELRQKTSCILDNKLGKFWAILKTFLQAL